MDLLPEVSKGQIYQSTISATLFLIYIIGLTTAVITEHISLTWILDRFIGLSFIGVITLIIFPVWRQSDSMIGKIMSQLGLTSFVLLVMTWFIYIVDLFQLYTPTGTIEIAVFDLATRFSFFTLFPFLVVVLYGRIDWEGLLDKIQNDAR